MTKYGKLILEFTAHLMPTIFAIEFLNAQHWSRAWPSLNHPNSLFNDFLSCAKWAVSQKPLSTYLLTFYEKLSAVCSLTNNRQKFTAKPIKSLALSQQPHETVKSGKFSSLFGKRAWEQTAHQKLFKFDVAPQQER